MITYLCHNEHCSNHIKLHTKNAADACIYVRTDGELERIERHMYRSPDGKNTFFLCDVCHAAVEMTKASQ